MKNLLLFLVFGVWCLPLIAGWTPAQLRQAKPETAASEGGQVWLIDEDAEGTGEPAGWTTSDSSTYWDYTVTVLAGAQSVMSRDATDYIISPTFADQSELWVYCMLRSTNTITARILIQVRDGTTSLAEMRITTPDVTLANGSTTTTIGGTGIYATDTTYHVWLRYVQGSGANGVSQLYISTTGTRPGSPTMTMSNGNATGLADNIVWGAGPTIRDNMKASPTSIGDQ